MVAFSPLRPGAWLMRRLKLPGKLGWCAAQSLVAVVLAVMAAPWWLTAVACVLMLYVQLVLWLTLSHDMALVARSMQQTTQGDLTAHASLLGHDEMAEMARSLDQMVYKLSAMVADIRSNAALVAHAGQSLAHGNRALADRTEQQAANLEETAASVEELSSTVQNNAHTALSADQKAAQVRQAADTGAQAMARAVQSVEAIQQGARRMSEIIGVIDGIAFQTNILALNAAVEAAREIRDLIQTSVGQVESSASLIRSAGEGISAMAGGIHSVAASMSEIASSSNEQSTGLKEISGAVQQLDQITQDNAQTVGLAVQQAEALEQRASTLNRAVAAFRLQQGTAEEAVALMRKAVELHRSTSLEQFLGRITDKAGGFHDRDMYVFVLDETGRYLAFGGNPAKVGTRVQDIPGIAGDQLVHDIVAQAQHGPGWVEYDITNPATGVVQTKMSFVSQVDAGYVGCGVYKTLAAR